MSSIVYSFHWVGVSRDAKKEAPSQSTKSTPLKSSTTNSIEMKNTSNSTLDSTYSGQREETSHKITLSPKFSISSDYCIPVQAVQELGCFLSTENTLFQGIFRSICERHQLCYACGFAHGITPRQCNKMTLLNIYEICSQNATLSSSDCIKQRFSTIKFRQQQDHRLINNGFESFFECHHNCVLNYLKAK